LYLSDQCYYRLLATSSIIRILLHSAALYANLKTLLQKVIGQLEKIQLEKVNETQAIQQKHDQDMKAMREEMNQQFIQIMSITQQNPQLAHIKPAALREKIKR
jgi:hypothetical protein